MYSLKGCHTEGCYLAIFKIMYFKSTQNNFVSELSWVKRPSISYNLNDSSLTDLQTLTTTPHHCRSKVHFERLRDRGLTRIKNLVCSFNRYFSMDVIFAKEIASRSQPLLFGTPSDLVFLAKLRVITLKDHYRKPYTGWHNVIHTNEI